MHYKDGTPAKIGDVVKGPHPNGPDDSGRTIIGTVIAAYPGADSCNINVQSAMTVLQLEGLRTIMPGEAYALTCTAGKFEKVL